MREEENSEQQGFFVDQMEIKNHTARYRKKSLSMGNNKNMSNNFQATCLRFTGILKKQPTLSYNTSANILSQQTLEPDNTNNVRNNNKFKTMPKGHPYFLYAINENYQLIYSRYGSKETPIKYDIQYISTHPQNAENQTLLNHVGKKGNFYKRIPDFETKGNNYHNQVVGRQQNSNNSSHSLVLDSRFECGNLHCAYKQTKKQQYILFTQNDTNTLGYNQWFYFSIQNNRAGVRYSFTIANFKKKSSFFKYGCKPAIFSLKTAQKNGCGWSRKINNVKYGQSPAHLSQQSKLYSLTFDIQLEHQKDYILIAMNLPYSYSRLSKFLSQMKSEVDNRKSQQNNSKSINIAYEVKPISRSICGNLVPQITITSASQNSPITADIEQQNQLKVSDKIKKMIIILARQHPGEIWSSYMMEGMIKYLLMANKPAIDLKNKHKQPAQQQSSQQVEWLLNHYIFKIYPMVNVDGVIYGNSRCDITGSDLNRQWKQPFELLFPQVHSIKNKIAQYSQNYQIDLCFDLHGHSKNYNVFAYSCKDNMYTCRVLPYIVSKTTPIFYMPSCTFGISKYKQTTARAVLYNLIKNQNVLTLQTSYYGSKTSHGKIQEFTPQRIFKIASDIIKAVKSFLHQSDKKQSYLKALAQIKKNFQTYIRYDEINQQEDSGSDSDPQVDTIDMKKKFKQIFDSSCIALQKINLGFKKNKKNDTQKISKLKKQKQKSVKNKFSIINFHEKSAEFRDRKIESKTLEPKRYQLECNIERGPDFQHNFSMHPQKGKFSLQNSVPYKKLSYQQTSLNFRQRNNGFNPIKNSQRKVNDKKLTLMQQMHVSLDGDIEKQRQIVHKKSTLFQTNDSPDIIENCIDHVRRSDEFVRKFSRFIPISMNSRNKSNSVMFENTVYNQDQSSLINMLFQNKKKLDLQKIRRDVKKSTKVVQRQGKMRQSRKEEGEKTQSIVDFKAFKQNEKINKQIRNISKINHERYLGDFRGI